MVEDTKIRELMDVPENRHDLDWLKKSLQIAIKLELSTLPPYLCAEWSIKSRLDPIRRSIHEIVREEMLHLALMCNMISAIGGSPDLNSSSVVPIYPGSLPGGVHPGLTVSLRGLSVQTAKVFMEIEFPEHDPVAMFAIEEFPTIGAFYSAIQTAFETLQPEILENKQLEGPLGLSKVRTIDDVRNAIQIIKRQGEGSQTSPEDSGPDDLAHYYRFGEIYHGRKLHKDIVTGEWKFDGESVILNGIRPMAEVPAGGYQQADVSQQVWDLLIEFDKNFTTMLNQLQSAWESGNSSLLNDAVMTMFSLPKLGEDLMEIPIPSRQGNYGPCFRLVSDA